MYKSPPIWDRINSYALVTYIPEPLAGFLDRLREELVPNCFLRAHVTILPPRPLVVSTDEAWEVLRGIARSFTSFEVQLGDVDVLPVSDVIYVRITAGNEILTRMHDAMNVDGLQRQEEFSYLPHVTLAQELESDEVDELVRVARIRWAESSLAKSFRAEKVCFVQNTRRNLWLDIAELELPKPETKPSGELKDQFVG